MTLTNHLSSRLKPGMRLDTPSGRATFVVESITTDGLNIIIGKRHSHITIPWMCFDRIEEELSHGEWIRTSAVRGQVREGSLEWIVHLFTHGVFVASYVAPILEYCRVAEIDRRTPHRIRLIKD